MLKVVVDVLEEDKAKDTVRDFQIGRKAWEVIKDTLVRLSTTKKLSVNCIDLYEKFTDESRYAPKPSAAKAATQE